MKKMILVVILVLIAVIIGGFTYYFISQKYFKNSNVNQPTITDIDNSKTAYNSNVNTIVYSSSTPVFGKLNGYNFRGQTKPLLDITFYTENLIFYDSVKEVLEDFPSYTRLVLKFFPLVQYHTGSQNFTEAVECANEQDEFWPFVDALLDEKSQNIVDAAAQSDEIFLSALSNAITKTGIDAQQFSNCILQEKYKEKVSAMAEEERNKNGITGAPTTIINGRPILGMHEDELRKDVNNELKSLLLPTWEKYSDTDYHFSFLYPRDYVITLSAVEDGKGRKVTLKDSNSGKVIEIYLFREWLTFRNSAINEQYTKSTVGSYQIDRQDWYQHVFTDKSSGQQRYRITTSLYNEQTTVVEALGTIEIWSDTDYRSTEIANLIAVGTEYIE